MKRLIRWALFGECLRVCRVPGDSGRAPRAPRKATNEGLAALDASHPPRGKIGHAALVCILVGAISGCAGDPESDGNKLRIGMMPKLVGIPFFNACERGANDAAAELGVQLVYDGPTADNPEDQAEIIDTWVAQGFDVIAVAPVDPESISTHLADAKNVGVTVLTWDTDANAERSGRSIFVNHTPNEGIANTLVDMMIDGVGDADGKLRGKFIIVSGSQTASNQNVWMDLMKPRLGEHPECKLLETLYPGEDGAKSLQATSDALFAHADLKGIWAITSVALPAAARAVQNANRADEVYVTGLSMPNSMREYIKNGTIEQFALFNVENLGYLTIQIAKRLSDQGNLPDGTYNFGRVKDVRVSGGQAVLGDPLIFNKENIDDHDF